MTSRYLVFYVAGRLFGARLLGAVEILAWRASRPVPLAYSYVEGLMDYRGVVYPVFNLAQRLGLVTTETQVQPIAIGSGKSILLLEENGNYFAIVADHILKMISSEEPVRSAEPIQGISPMYLKGTVHDDDQEILILDFERLFHAG